MAKITLENGMVIEGTVEELKEMAKSFVELKGYRKVDRKPQLGDFVKFSENVCDVTPGKYYEIIKLDSDGDPMIIDDIDDEYCLYGDEDSFEVFEKAAPVSEEPKPEPLKVGDYVLTLSDSKFGQMEQGTIGVVTETGFPAAEYSVIVNELNLQGCYTKGDGAMFRPQDLVIASEEEITEAKRQLAVAEKWAKIGRKPNEFKEGDIVIVKESEANSSYHEKGDIGEITTNASRTEFRVKTGRNDSVNWVRPIDVELITPVESRFDRA